MHLCGTSGAVRRVIYYSQFSSPLWCACLISEFDIIATCDSDTINIGVAHEMPFKNCDSASFFNFPQAYIRSLFAASYYTVMMFYLYTRSELWVNRPCDSDLIHTPFPLPPSSLNIRPPTRFWPSYTSIHSQRSKHQAYFCVLYLLLERHDDIMTKVITALLDYAI